MARPTIDHLLDCQIQIWRPSTMTDTIGVEERVYVPMDVVDAIINRPAIRDSDVGGGMGPMGTVRWYGKPTIDVRDRDVCEVISGPEVGRTFEVDGPPVHPKNHHTQVDCIMWNGTLEVDS